MNLLRRLQKKLQATPKTTAPVHGGRLQQAVADTGIPAAEWLDLSTGINPQPWPVPSVPASFWQRLPESSGQLKQAARRYYGGCTDDTDLVAMPGSQWFIQTFPRLAAQAFGGDDTPLSVLIPDIGFSEHGYWWEDYNQQAERYQEAAVTELLDSDLQADVLVLINPNNPSGRQIPAQHILNSASRNAATLFIVDEAFVDSRPELSLLSHSGPLPENLILLRSLGKFFGLAGLRVGFCIAHRDICRLLEQELGPWPMATASEQLAIQALQDKSWQVQARQQLKQFSAWQFALLQSLFRDQISLYHNDFFITLDFPSPELADKFHQALLQQAILSRRIENSTLLRLGLVKAADRDLLQQRLEIATRHIFSRDYAGALPV